MMTMTTAIRFGVPPLLIVKCCTLTFKKREWMFEEGLSVSCVFVHAHLMFTLDKKQEVVITHILSDCNQVSFVVSWQKIMA